MKLLTSLASTLVAAFASVSAAVAASALPTPASQRPPKTKAESRTKNRGRRPSFAAVKRAAKKRRNVLRNKRAHRN